MERGGRKLAAALMRDGAAAAAGAGVPELPTRAGIKPELLSPQSSWHALYLVPDNGEACGSDPTRCWPPTGMQQGGGKLSRSGQSRIRHCAGHNPAGEALKPCCCSYIRQTFLVVLCILSPHRMRFSGIGDLSL